MAVSAAACCSQLATISGLTVAYSNTAAYNTTEQQYWSLQESTLVPTCIVTPHTSYQAANAIFHLTNHPSCSTTEFAIKGNGHAPTAAFANINNGITIDTTSLTTTSLSADHSTVTLGAGLNWLDAYAYLDPHHLTVAGGRNGLVGISGLTLGGGISYFSPQVGFTCDTAVNFEVVLANGALVRANKTSNPDLFRALKGGTNNFGLLTSVTLITIPYTTILGDTLPHPLSSISTIFDTFSSITTSQQYDIHASIVLGLLFNSTSNAWSLSTTPIYTTSNPQPPAIYAPLLANTLPPISPSATPRTLHQMDLSTYSNESRTPPLNWLFLTSTYTPSTSLLLSMFDLLNTTLRSPPLTTAGAEVQGVNWDFAFEPLPTAFTAVGSNASNLNSLGTSPADGNSMILLISAFWPAGKSDNTATNAAVQSKAQHLRQQLNNAAKEVGGLKKFIYANYAGEGQDVFGSYGAEELEFLRGVSRKYDPEGVWQRKVPGGFKLWP